MTIRTLQESSWRLVRSVAAWPVASHQQSRRNALVAGTALVERRRELLEVEEFIVALEAGRAAGTPDAATDTA